MRRKFRINPAARKEAKQRSGGWCERCGKDEAVHMHHLTYERAGVELPEDLEHICLYCHIQEHPHNAPEMIDWELKRKRRIAAAGGGPEVEEETDDEREQIAYDERERERETEDREWKNEPAWNLGKYTASGYCLDEVEEEEERRRYDERT